MIKRFQLMLIAATFVWYSNISATSVNGRFIVLNADSIKLSLLLQINTNTGTDAIGGATIVIGFDTSVTTFKSNPITNTDYIIHNFCSGNYSPATITRPMSNKIWINIDLPFNNSNNGTIVAGGNNWTDAATIHFDVADQQGLASFMWITNSTFWGVYDDDNISLWNIGQFENLVNIIIPVELSSFTASLLNNNLVQLRWTTATSLNNLGFDIERKISTSTSHCIINWEKIAFVEGIGNSTTLQEYSYTDVAKHIQSEIEYRLKVIDLDGSFVYSDVVEVETVPINFELDQNYPNPFNPSTKISWQSPVSCHQTIKVYDILGNEVATLVDEFKSAGSYEVDFQSASDGSAGSQQLASGMYIYRLTTDNYSETKKMMLVR